MKIKIIDLLVKDSNGEEMPKKIKFNNVIWEYKDENKDYYSTYTGEPFFNDYSSLGAWIMKHLNVEVEIIEEDKPIEELEDYNYSIKGNRDKINELVKEINKLKKTINKITGTDKVIEEIKKEIDKLKENK